MTDTDGSGSSEALPVEVRAYRLALDPSEAQALLFEQYAGTSRWAYNFALGLITQAHKAWRARVAELVEAGDSEEHAKQLLKDQAKEASGQRKQLDEAVQGLREQLRLETDATARGVFRSQIENLTQVKQRKLAGHVAAGALVPSAFDIAAIWRATRDAPADEGGSPWWPEINVYVFTKAFSDACAAWSNWLKSLSGQRAGFTGYPKFKARGRARDSFTLFHNVKAPTIRLDGYRAVMVPRIGRVRLRDNARRLARALRVCPDAAVTSITVARSGVHWFAAVLVRSAHFHVVDARETGRMSTLTPTKRQQLAGAVAVRWGVGEVTLHREGGGIEQVPQPKALAKEMKRLRAASQALSRTRKPDREQPDSRRRKIRRERVARLHQRIVNKRQAFLHELTKKLATEHAAVCVEDVDVAAMLAREVKPAARRRRINRALADASPGELRRQLEYKTARYAAELRSTPRGYPSTRTCSRCGNVNAVAPAPGEDFKCERCAVVLDRASNAVVNVAMYAQAEGAGG